MPVRIVVGSRIQKKIRVQIQELITTEKPGKEKTKHSENFVIYDDEGKLDMKEMKNVVEQALTEYAKTKGEVTKY